MTVIHFVRAAVRNALPAKSSQRDLPRSRFSGVVVPLSTSLLVVTVSQFAVIGGDARWLSALGNIITATRHVPTGVPYTAAASNRWPNVPILAELVFSAATRLAADRGLLMLQVCALIVALLVLTQDAQREGASPQSSALVLLLVGLGGVTAFYIVRVQLFSLLLFPVLMLLLRSDYRKPTRRLWLVIPLLALWSNLHGGAVVGYAVTGSYLLLSRRTVTPARASLTLLAGGLALCANPALWNTPSYYQGLLTNESARQSVGLWARLSFSSPFDLMLLFAVGIFAYGTWLRQPPLWELGAMGGLAVMTADASRSGIWLLLISAPAAAIGLSTRGRQAAAPHAQPHRALPLTVLGGGCLALSLALVSFRGPPTVRADDRLLAHAVILAHGGVIASDGVAAEQIALDGGCLWIANPLDAFSHHDQRRYLSWLADGDPELLPPQTRAVVVGSGGAAASRLAVSEVFHLVDSSSGLRLYQLAKTTSGHPRTGCARP